MPHDRLRATDEAYAERQRLLDEAQKDADDYAADAKTALRAEQRLLNQEIARRTQKEVFAITRKTLADLAGTSLDDRMSEGVRGPGLRGLSGAAKAQMATALVGSALVRSRRRFTSVMQRAAIESAVKETFDLKIQVQFHNRSGVDRWHRALRKREEGRRSIADYPHAREERR